MDNYEIDSHKLDRHPGRVADWIGGKIAYPIYMEMSPSGACNHRCVFCSFDYVGYRKRFLDMGSLRHRLPEMARLGVRAIQYAGEGEPLLHGDIVDIVRCTSGAEIDVGMSTNAVLLNRQLCDQLLPECAWIKVSFNAGRKDTYAKVNRCRPEDFDAVLSNLRYAAGQKRECTLGIQMVVLPENVSEMLLLAELAKDIGMDYVVFKPYARSPYSKHGCFDDVHVPFDAWDAVRGLQTQDFKVVVRENAIRRSVEKGRSFSRCLAFPFWCYLDSKGDVWGCFRHLGNEEFHYGNVYRNSFEQVWDGSMRKRKRLAKSFDISECGINCRMEEINRYLWRLKRPEAHDNFI